MQLHIIYLLEVEKTMNVRFNRTGENTIVLSSEGYIHQDLMTVEKALLKLGCRYNFDKPLQQYDKMCERTFTYMNEPKDEE